MNLRNGRDTVRLLQFAIWQSVTLCTIAACVHGDRSGAPAGESSASGNLSKYTQRQVAVVAPPRCGQAGVTCFHDTTYSHREPYDPNPSYDARWIWFGSAGDSLEVFGWVHTNLQSLEGAYISTNLGQERNPRGNTASYLRRRLLTDGVVEIRFSLDNIIGGEILGDTTDYTLAVREVGNRRAAMAATGRWATLRIVSTHVTDQFSLVPLSHAVVTDRSKWRIRARTYRVALLSDSLYELCRLPCVHPDTILLTAFGRSTLRYR